MRGNYKKYAYAFTAALLTTSTLLTTVNAFTDSRATTVNIEQGGKYDTNGIGTGQYKTINSFSDWSEDMIIAQGVANDDARIFRGSHEGPVYDTYALYGAWDDSNLYLMWQFVNVTDVVDPAQNYPISDNGKPWNGDIPQILAFSIDPSKSGNGAVKSVDSKTGTTKYEDNIWGVRVNYETKVDTLMYFSSKSGVGEPAIFKVEDDSYFSYDNCIGFKDAGVTYKYADGFLGDTMMGIKSNGWSGYKPADLFNDSSNWVNMLNQGHDTKQDTMYSMTIPLNSLGIDKAYIENNGIGVMHISTFGQSGIASIPFDESMLDVATEEYGPDPSTSAEKDDYDVVTAPLARIGNTSGVKQITVNNINTSKESPQVVGTDMDIITEATGGEGKLKYTVSVHEITDGWKLLDKASESNIISWTPQKAGKYTIWVDVKDDEGNRTSKSIEYIVK